MISKPNAVVSKGMVFAGCSFTWGQGLYYYSNLSTLREPLPDHYDSSLVTSSHIEYMRTIRYPRLVSNYFNTFEYVHPNNGGSNHSAIAWWDDCFNNFQLRKANQKLKCAKLVRKNLKNMCALKQNLFLVVLNAIKLTLKSSITSITNLERNLK